MKLTTAKDSNIEGVVENTVCSQLRVYIGCPARRPW